MRKGEYVDSIVVLRQTIEKFGLHVGILQDLVSACYWDGRIEEWKMLGDKLFEEFQKAEPLLEPSKRARIYRDLGKIFEEQAQYKKALGFYQQGAKVIAGDDEQASLSLSLQCQVLRLKSQMKEKRGLGEIYRKLSQARAEKMSYDLFVDLEHSLILAEAVLVGCEAGALRFESLSERELSSRDKNLIYFDLLEIYLLESKNWESSVSFHAESCDEFEKALAGILRGEEVVTLAKSLYWQRRMSPTCWLRLITLELNRVDDDKLLASLQNQLAMTLEGLDTETCHYWMSRWTGGSSTARDFILNSEEKKLSVVHACVDFSRRQTGYALVEVFLQGNSFAIEEVISKVWGEELSVSAMDRLRKLASRVNKLVLESTGCQDFLIWKKDVLSLNGRYQLHQ